MDGADTTQRELLDETATLMGAKRPGAVPTWLAALVAGSIAVETMTLYVIYNLEQRGRLLNNLHYVYSELVSDVLFQRSRARLYIIDAHADPSALLATGFHFRYPSHQQGVPATLAVLGYTPSTNG